jgi:hypothetical protein
MDMYSMCMDYIVLRHLTVEDIDYGTMDLEENLEQSSKLIRGMIAELQTATPERRVNLLEELDSAVLGWVETWNALQ